MARAWMPVARCFRSRITQAGVRRGLVAECETRVSTPRLLLAALLLGACVDHLKIGSIAPEVDAATTQDASVRPVDARVDAAAPPPDARPSEDAAVIRDAEPPTPMRAWLRILGREPISELTVNCGAACTAVEAIVEGGTPPYQFRWGDGQEGSPRLICATTNVLLPAPNAPSVVLEVSDATQQLSGVRPALSTPGECAPTGGPSWNACIAPVELGARCDGAAAGLWYDMITPWDEPSSQARFAFSLTAFASASVEVYTATSLCEGVALLGSGSVQFFSASFELALQPQPFAPRYLMVRNLNAADGLLLPELTPIVSVCFAR